VKSDVLRSHSPLRQLLYVEWILLGMAVLMAVPSFLLYPAQGLAWLEFGVIAVLAVMGLWLPQQRLAKLSYTAFEVGLLLLLAADNGQAHLRPLLGLVVVIRSCQLFQIWGRVVVVAIVFALHAVTALAYGQIPLSQEIAQRLSVPPTQWQTNLFKTNLLVFFALVLVFVLLLVDALLSVYRSQQELAEAHDQLRCYAAKIESQATLQERNRIAREIHDSLGHALTAQTILLENALLFLPPQADQARDYLQRATASAYQALREVSTSVSTLRSRPVQEAPLQRAIPTLVNDVCKSAQISSECLVELPEPLSEEINLALFRIVQEALTNTVKHSQASQVRVKLIAKPEGYSRGVAAGGKSSQDSYRLHLQILDNGKGFDPSKNTTGFGLRGMRERATALGGTYQIWSAPGAGCRISVILPLPTAIEHLA